MKIKAWIAKDKKSCFLGEYATCLFSEKPVLMNGFYRASTASHSGRTPMMDFLIPIEPGECREVTIEVHEPVDSLVCPGCGAKMGLMIEDDGSCVLGNQCNECGRREWYQVPVPYTPPKEKNDVQN